MLKVKTFVCKKSIFVYEPSICEKVACNKLWFVYECVSVSEQNYRQTDSSILMQFLLNGCFYTGLALIEIGELQLKVKINVTEKVSQNDEQN